MKHNPLKKVHIEISCKTVENYYRFRVRDNGKDLQ